jgi:radical SAM protein with 4Fe4S-binding SPASM domain
LTVIGGEAYLRSDWLRIIAAARSHGMFVGMQTGARALTERRLAAAAEAGLQGIGVSLDGLAELHDELRGVPGSFAHGILTLTRARELGLHTSVNTQIGPRTSGDLPRLLELIADAGVGQWQLQLTVAMGNAVDNPQLILQPFELLELMPLLAGLYSDARARGVLLIPGNNIGYFGPYESLWRMSVDDRPHWSGCGAGDTVIGLESDGTVKGCPSLATSVYAGGNIRDLGLENLWDESRRSGNLRPSRELWGFCKTCYYGDVCGGGCTWTAHSLLGRPGNNPYCHHRVLTLAQQGRRERIVKVEDAGPASFAVGRFALIEEPLDGSGGCERDGVSLSEWSSNDLASTSAVGGAGPSALRLRLCHGCEQYVHEYEQNCPFCGGDLAVTDQEYEAASRHRRKLIEDVRDLLGASQRARS